MIADDSMRSVEEAKVGHQHCDAVDSADALNDGKSLESSKVDKNSSFAQEKNGEEKAEGKDKKRHVGESPVLNSAGVVSESCSNKKRKTSSSSVAADRVTNDEEERNAKSKDAAEMGRRESADEAGKRNEVAVEAGTKNRKSIFNGVRWDTERGAWHASINIERKLFEIGYFETERSAAEAYDIKCYLTRGLQSPLNFGIPKRFIRAGGNVLFVPGPNKWFLRFKNETHNVAVGYFQSADAAQSAYQIALDAYIRGHLDGLNTFRAFLFSRCFIGTDIAPWSHDVLSGGAVQRRYATRSSSSDARAEQETPPPMHMPICMLCCVAPALYITLPCRHIFVCADCKAAYESPDPSQRLPAATSLATAQYIQLQCPLCQFPCIIGANPALAEKTRSMNDDVARPTVEVFDKHAPVFRFPRALESRNGNYVVVNKDWEREYSQDLSKKTTTIPRIPPPHHQMKAPFPMSASSSSNVSAFRPTPANITGTIPQSYVARAAPRGQVNMVSSDSVRCLPNDGAPSSLANDREDAACLVDFATATSELHGNLSIRLNGGEKSRPMSAPTRVFTSNSRCVKSSYRGVCWDTRKKKWKAQIGHQGETMYLGHFDSETDAALTYDESARMLHQHRAKTNFDLNGFRTQHFANRSEGSGYKKSMYANRGEVLLPTRNEGTNARTADA